jgi:pimeloyl-ACP methyl ester carboxylesterase
MSKRIYLIPGMGADARMYEPQLRVLPNCLVLEHQAPLPGETIREYAQRFAAHIDTSEPFILVGTSLGGMISIELSKILKPDKVILISSVKHRGELPAWMRAMKHLNLHKLISGRRFIKVSILGAQKLLMKRDTRIARLIIDMHTDADPAFIEWAMNAVINWEAPADHRDDVIHIHGTRDSLFPYKNARGAIAVKGGTHIMGLTQAHDVNRILLEHI